MKVLIGPMNIASQPYYLARGLRKKGIEAKCVVYGKGSFGYEHDWFVELKSNGIERAKIFRDTLKQSLTENYDIYHFFQRSLFMSTPPRRHDKLSGFDIPLLKARGKLIAYRFTGWELIDRDLELKNNAYSAFKHGWDGFFDTHLKKEYLDFLKAYCDAFMVVDPMMHEHIPEATIVPRILPVNEFEEVGIENKVRPLVLHAPTNTAYKGSKYILKALKELMDEGVKFDLEILDKVPHKEAIERYKRADIIIDQILIGWYGVLATECMAMGKPVAVYMREDLVKTPEEVPVHNINLGNVKSRLRQLIEDYDLRHKLASKGREYVKKVHDEDVVIQKLINVYEEMLKKGPCYPRSMADIDFLYYQRVEIEKKLSVMKRLDFRMRSDRIAGKLVSIPRRILSKLKRKLAPRSI